MARPNRRLNFYGDLVLPLAQSTTLEDYLADTSDGPATPEVQKARQVIWQRLRGTSFTSERLQPAMFIHFGTSREYWETVAADVNVAAHLRLGVARGGVVAAMANHSR